MTSHRRPPGMRKIVIVGLPNTGKTQVFNNLTGTYRLVANYPSTTVTMNLATVELGGERCDIVDLPGFRGFYVNSEEDLSARALLIRKRPDLLIQCVDANRLKPSLFLTAELLELGIPLVISLNAVDETARNGKRVDGAALAGLLGVPVVESVAVEGRGTEELKKAMRTAAPGGVRIEYFPLFDNYTEKLGELLPSDTPFKRLAAHLLLQKDGSVPSDRVWFPEEYDWGPLRATVDEAMKKFHGHFNKAVRAARSRWVDRVEARVVSIAGKRADGFFRKAAALSRHPFGGIPFLLAFLALSYFSVVYVAGFLEGLLNGYLFDPLISFLARIIPAGFISDMLIGRYGVLTLGLFSAIGTVLPVLFVFFIVFGLMEDVGYLPNLGILLRRVLGRLGLSGKSVMPLLLGFGCKTMATLAVKGIPSRKEKLIAVYLIAFAIPCSAQLALVIAILGNTGILSFFIYLVFLTLVEGAAGIVLNRLMKDDQPTDYIQELPPFRLPRLRAVMRKTFHRTLWFLKEAVPIFIIASLAIFLIDRSGVLTAVKEFVAPVVTGWLGLPINMVDALLLTLARNEIGAGFILNLSGAGMLSWTQSIVAVVLTTMFVPCIANVVAMVKEVGLRASIVILIAINVTSVGLAGGLNMMLTALVGR